MSQIDIPNFLSLTISSSQRLLHDSTTGDPLVLESLTFEEDMFSESLIGSITLYDPTAGAQIINSILIPDVITISIGTQSWQFDVLDINWVSDLATQSLTTTSAGGSFATQGRPHKAVVRFSSKLFVYDNFNYSPFNDFIGLISGFGVEPDSGSSDLSPAGDVGLESFVHNVAEYSGIGSVNLDADDTANSIWFKNDPSFYPFSKIGNNPTTHQIMNYVSEYACRRDKPWFVDFLFWQDLTGWKFKSVSKLAESRPVFDYIISPNEYDTNAIASFEVINTISPAKLISSGAFFGEYVRVKPDWSSIYQNSLDTNGELVKERIVGQYPENISNLKIANTPVGTFTPQNTGTLRMSDTNYGYFANPYNANAPWWSYADNINKYSGDLTQTQLDLKQPERNESTNWRSQFDFCELPGSWLYKIYNNIKWNRELLTAKQEYLELKRERARHDAFKNKMCCIREVPETFFAVLTRAEKIYGSEGQTVNANDISAYVEKDSGGIYAYEWTEVEFWPRDDVQSVVENREIIEFEDNTFPFVFAVPPGAARGVKGSGLTADNRAYNLNEILNSRIPREFGGETFPNTIIKGPGISNIHALMPDDAETRKEYVSYPKQFSLMPVGKYRITTNKKCNPNWADDGTVGLGTASQFYQGGRVVQMFKIPKEGLNSIIGKTLASETSEIQPLDQLFIFDVENDHDGLCPNCGGENN